jgi:hypothetical protein
MTAVWACADTTGTDSSTANAATAIVRTRFFWIMVSRLPKVG